MRTLRLFALLDALRHRTTPVTAETLAAELEVSVRTLYRDVAALQALGAPLRGEAGIGYQLEPGAFLPPLHFDPDELDAVMLGLRLIAARGDAGLAQAAVRASGRIAAALPDGDRDRALGLPLQAVAKRTEAADAAALWLGPLRRAIRDRAVLRLHYRALDERTSDRIARPLGLTVFDSVWLLTIWCETRQDFRNLRVDRLEAVTPTGATFRPERGRRFRDYLETL